MKYLLAAITIISISGPTLARTGDVIFDYEIQKQAEILMEQGRIPSNTNEQNSDPQGHEDQGEHNEDKKRAFKALFSIPKI